MDDHDNIIEQREALLDGVNFICSKLERVHDKKRSNFFLIAQVLITLALPQNKKGGDIQVQDLFNATDMVNGVLEEILLKERSTIN